MTIEGVHQVIHRPVVALGHQAPDGTIVIDCVLCANFPDMTNKETATLSRKLDEWVRFGRKR